MVATVTIGGSIAVINYSPTLRECARLAARRILWVRFVTQCHFVALYPRAVALRPRAREHYNMRAFQSLITVCVCALRRSNISVCVRPAAGGEVVLSIVHMYCVKCTCTDLFSAHVPEQLNRRCIELCHPFLRFFFFIM